MQEILLFGVVVGLGAAAFPGPINLEVVRRSVSQGPRLGASFGYGAASADVLWAMGTALGATALIGSLPVWGQAGVYLVGAILLLYLGLIALRVKTEQRTLDDVDSTAAANVPISARSGPKHESELRLQADASHPSPSTVFGMIKSYVFGFFITLTSPSTIAYWVWVSAAAARHAREEQSVALPLGAGVGAACVVWVTIASTAAGCYHKKISARTYLLVERVAGIALCVLAVNTARVAIHLLMHWHKP